ncbi:MAG: hypothetical protein IKF99_21060 [Oscillospiraceae bacterium]|nr:hypothetical protein [Oscillospiraceae bacterium]
MNENNFTPDYARLEAEAQNNPSYAYGRLWQEADEKVHQIKAYLDGLYDGASPTDWERVTNMARLNELLDQALQLIELEATD